MKSFVCITGAAGGLGKAFAAECARRGWDLFITDLAEEALAKLARGLENAYGTEVLYRSCDLTDPDSRTGLIEYMSGRELCFRGLINVAGLDFEGPFSERSREQIRTILRLNIEANLEMTYALLRLRDRGSTFRIINVSSLASYYPMPIKAVYAASKRFLLDFSLALREELRHLGVTVTALCPAGMPTNEPCIRAIDAQGFLGRITTKNVGFVASRTVDHALKGRAVYVPGTINRFIRFIGSLVPATVVARLVGSRWEAARKKRSKGLREPDRRDAKNCAA